MTTDLTCCFTGHRPTRLPWGNDEDDPRCITLKEQLTQALEDTYQGGIRRFLCGMAQGGDFYFCEGVIALRECHPDVILVAVVPCPQQADRWRSADKERYHQLLEACDEVVLVQHNYTRDCMLRRNRYMVNAASHIIAIYDGVMKGGTTYTLAYALKQGLELTIIDIPSDLY